MKIFYASQHANHCPKQFYVWGGFVGVSPDLLERAENIRETLKADGHTILEAPDFGPKPIAEVHTPDYLDYHRHQLVQARRYGIRLDEGQHRHLRREQRRHQEHPSDSLRAISQLRRRMEWPASGIRGRFAPEQVVGGAYPRDELQVPVEEVSG